MVCYLQVASISKSGEGENIEPASTNPNLVALDSSQVGGSITPPHPHTHTHTHLFLLSQILQLLELMGPSMSKHRDTFSREGIDGELLSYCTEEILETELGISSHLDRLKLMQVYTYSTHCTVVEPRLARPLSLNQMGLCKGKNCYSKKKRSTVTLVMAVYIITNRFQPIKSITGDVIILWSVFRLYVVQDLSKAYSKGRM